MRLVANKDLIVDLSTIDFNHVVADIEVIRRYNPQRFEMEQLTAIVHEDPVQNICVAYKDVTDHEFWVRGHMPGMPLMPGVVMCEAAAQVCGYYTKKYNLLGENKVVGFGGLEEVRFRDPVRVGDRLVLMCQLIKLRPGAMSVSRFQGVVREQIVVEGKMKGIPLPVDVLLKLKEATA
jgi:3-hydroxyacyl-[acyl-carrier-protein] dehydratase